MVDIIILLFFIISWIISHLGMNPVSGGRPPMDSIMIKIIMEVRGNLFHEYDREVIVVVIFTINNEKIVIVIKMYMYRFSNIIVGLYAKIAIIQPM